MKIKLTGEREVNMTYEEILNIDNNIMNYYRNKFPEIYDVNHILPAFFENAYRDSLLEVELPATIREIQGQAFENCEYVKKVKLNHGLNTILNHSFANCHSLEQITIPNTVTAIQNAFYNCKNLKKVIFEPHPVVHKEKNTQVTVREAIEAAAVVQPEYTNDCAFENCENLAEIDIANIPRIEKKAFLNCPNIKKIKLNIGEDQKQKIAINLEENEQFFDIQKEKDCVVIQTKIDEKIRSKLISISKKRINTFDFDVVLNGEGRAFKNFKFFSDITEEDLKTNKFVAVNGDDFFSIDYVYSDDDVRKIKAKIEEIKKEVLKNSEGLSQKELYTRMVTSLSHIVEYDFAGVCIMDGALGRTERLQKDINMCQSVTKMNYDDYIVSKVGINPRELFHNMNNVHKVISIIKDYRNNTRSARGLLTGKTICYSNPEIIRNIAHELGIEARYFDGSGHSWNQVYLDGTWYDDDFTNYNERIRAGQFDKEDVKMNFLRGYAMVGGERKREFFNDTEHTYRATRPTGEDVGDSVPHEECTSLLHNATEHYKNITDFNVEI